MTDVTKHFSPALARKSFGEAANLTVYKGKGCKICRQTGYVSRVGIFEVLEVTKSIRKLITEKADSDVINQTAITEGMGTMLDDGLQKVAEGLTTLEEVLRVTKVESL